VTNVVPAPPRYSARELLREIQKRGGRIFRMPLVSVFCLTNDESLAAWLRDLGGHSFTPAGMDVGADGGYWRDRPNGLREWDIYIHTIPVRGETTIHEAAKANRKVELEAVV